MFASTPKIDATPKSLGNINADDLNSNQQIVPITYLAGRRFIAGQFITPAYNQKTKAVQSATGKNSSGTVGYIYYADFALAFCMGGRQPVEAVFKVIVDSEIVWESSSGVWFGGAESVDIAVENFGTLRIYKGTFTQPIDSLFVPRGTVSGGIDPRLPRTWPYRTPTGGETTYTDATGALPSGEDNPIDGHYDTHPAYRPMCIGIFLNWKLGRDRTQIPNIQVELQRSVPWFDGSAADRAATGLNATASGVNLVGVLYDVITDPIFGIGQSVDSFFNVAGWEAALTNAAWLLASPRITQQAAALELLATIIAPFGAEVKSYLDGFLREKNGLLDIGIFTHGNIDTSTLPILTDDDLANDPELTPTGYDQIDTTFFVKYSDHDHYYQSYPQRYDDPNARRQAGEERRVVDQRDWITDAAIAKQWVSEAGVIRTKIGYSGQLHVRREWLDNKGVSEGDRFVWNSASRGLSIVLWIVETEWPEDRSGQITLTVENERGLWPTIYVPPPDTSLGDFFIEPLDIPTHFIRELPSSELKTEGGRQIAVLALRPDISMRGFRVWTSRDGTTYALALGEQRFAAFGKVKSATYGVTASPDTLTGMVLDLYGPDIDRVLSQTDQQRDANSILCFCGNEIMSVGQVVALGSGRYKIFFKRGLYGTPIESHVVDSNVWIIERTHLVALGSDFSAGETRHFKLQGFTSAQDIDLASCTAFTFTFGTGSSVPAPTNFQQFLEASPGNVNAVPTHQLRTTWDYPSDVDVVSFEAAIIDSQLPSPGSHPSGYPNWTYAKVTAPVKIWPRPFFGFWTLAVRAINSFGEKSDLSDDPSTWQRNAGLGLIGGASSAGRWQFGDDGSLYGWNQDTSAWVPVELRGGSSATIARLKVGTKAISGTSTATIDWSTAPSFNKTLGANITFAFSNTIDGDVIVVALTQDATGGRTVTWPTVQWAGGSAPTQTNAANKTDVYTFTQINGTIYGSVVQNFS